MGRGRFNQVITSGLAEIQMAKIPLVIRLTRHLLTSNPCAKVIIYTSYEVCLEMLRTRFEDLRINIVELSGRKRPSERTRAINDFNLPDSKHRVIIASPVVGGVGINLHDTDGRFPRYTLILPDARVVNQHQATGRTYRYGLQSSAYIRFIYGVVELDNHEVFTEFKLLLGLCQKGRIIHEVVGGQEGVVFPDEYPAEIEGLDPMLVPQGPTFLKMSDQANNYLTTLLARAQQPSIQP